MYAGMPQVLFCLQFCVRQSKSKENSDRSSFMNLKQLIEVITYTGIYPPACGKNYLHYCYKFALYCLIL